MESDFSTGGVPRVYLVSVLKCAGGSASAGWGSSRARRARAYGGRQSRCVLRRRPRGGSTRATGGGLGAVTSSPLPPPRHVRRAGRVAGRHGARGAAGAVAAHVDLTAARPDAAAALGPACCARPVAARLRRQHRHRAGRTATCRRLGGALQQVEEPALLRQHGYRDHAVGASWRGEDSAARAGRARALGGSRAAPPLRVLGFCVRGLRAGCRPCLRLKSAPAVCLCSKSLSRSGRSDSARPKTANTT